MFHAFGPWRYHPHVMSAASGVAHRPTPSLTPASPVYPHPSTTVLFLNCKSRRSMPQFTSLKSFSFFRLFQDKAHFAGPGSPLGGLAQSGCPASLLNPPHCCDIPSRTRIARDLLTVPALPICPFPSTPPYSATESAQL